MKHTHMAVLLVTVALVSGLTGFGLHQWLQTSAGPERPDPAAPDREAAVPDKRPEFKLPDLDGTMRHVGEWDGKVLLINFWATWCPPCVREVPAFMELQEEYGPQGFQVVGVAIDDVEAVREFAESVNANYPMLVGEEAAARISEEYGNSLGALPYSVMVDRDGTIRFVQRGELYKDVAEAELKPLL